MKQSNYNKFEEEYYKQQKEGGIRYTKFSQEARKQIRQFCKDRFVEAATNFPKLLSIMFLMPSLKLPKAQKIQSQKQLEKLIQQENTSSSKHKITGKYSPKQISDTNCLEINKTEIIVGNDKFGTVEYTKYQIYLIQNIQELMTNRIETYYKAMEHALRK